MLHSAIQNGISKPHQSIAHRPLPGYPGSQAGSQREKNPLSRKRKLTRNQERQRIEGLRILARIIARHYLEHPELYPQPVDAAEGRAEGGGKATGREGAE